MQTLSAHNHFVSHFNTNLCYQGHLDFTSDFIPSINRSKSYDNFENSNKILQQEGLKTRSESTKEHKNILSTTPTHTFKGVPKVEKIEKERETSIKNDIEVPTAIYIDESTPEREYFMRCVVIGEENTGKHTLINSSFLEKRKDPAYNRTTSDLLIKTATKFKTTKKYHFWVKTSGNSTKTKENIWKAYYKSANAFVFVYDITNRESLEALRDEVQEVLKVVPQEKFFGVLVGTKSDLKGKRAVDMNDAIDFQRKYKINHFLEKSSIKEEETSQLLVRLDNKLKLTFEAI